MTPMSESKIIAECWTCCPIHTSWTFHMCVPWPLNGETHNDQETVHRAAGHDVRVVGEVQEGKP